MLTSRKLVNIHVLFSVLLFGLVNKKYFKLLLILYAGRMGNTKQALALITNEMRDVDKAIDFCKEHDDSELWEDLINYSMDKPCKCSIMSKQPNWSPHLADRAKESVQS